VKFRFSPYQLKRRLLTFIVTLAILTLYALWLVSRYLSKSVKFFLAKTSRFCLVVLYLIWEVIKMTTSTTRPLDRHELQQILEKAKPYWKSCIIIGFATGLRLVDLLSLRKDFPVPRFHIVEQKTGKHKTVNLPSWSIDSWNFLKAMAPESEFLFTIRDKSSYRKMMKTLAKSSGVNPDGVAWHTLRKTIASFMAERSGVSAAQVFLNHSSAKTTMLYLASDIIALEQIYQGFPNGL
jgi:integrase